MIQQSIPSTYGTPMPDSTKCVNEPCQPTRSTKQNDVYENCRWYKLPVQSLHTTICVHSSTNSHAYERFAQKHFTSIITQSFC